MMHTFSKPTIGSIIRAPGKLVLAGEYAVLDGCPSIVLAIDRGVECIVQPGQGISTPMNDDRFVRPALEHLSKTTHYFFQDWNPVHSLSTNQKPGFGGSAAACVASCFAAGINPKDAFRIHHQVQGSGSGIDVAASIHGGMFRFLQGEITPLKTIIPTVIWTGRSAKTGPRVRQYLQWSQRTNFVQQSTLWAERFPDSPLESTHALFQLLTTASQRAGIDYLTPEIVEVCQLAQQYNGAAKPSGAGGGDCIVAFFESDSDRQEFSHCCKNTYDIIDINTSNGVHCAGQIS